MDSIGRHIRRYGINMGCDIHAYEEKYIDRAWVTPGKLIRNEEDSEDMGEPWYELTREISISRNYALFGLLAQVRNNYLGDLCHPDKEFPDDASEEVEEMFHQWDYDAHTPSFHTLAELKEMKKDINMKNLLIPFSDGVSWITDALEDIIKQFDPTDNEEHSRMVFWFDN